MSRGTILIADDGAIRTVLDQALGRAGYEVRSTANAATLWRWIGDGQGDLVITDVVMPDENGLDLLPRIKKIRPDMPVIVMSAQSTILTAIKAAERQLRLPASLQTTFQGNAQAFQQSLTTIPLLIAAALFVVYLILGILYESYIHPITILSTLPSAGAGALATLMIFGYDFSLVAMIGIILLIGIVKKNGIMLVDFAIHAERNEHLPAVEAIRKASLLRFRPIMMTTLAALLGGVPLMFGAGTGAEIRQPLGYAMVGGLAISQVLTLFTTPVIFLYMDRLSDWVTRTPREPAATQAPSKSADKPPRGAKTAET